MGGGIGRGVGEIGEYPVIGLLVWADGAMDRYTSRTTPVASDTIVVIFHIGTTSSSHPYDDTVSSNSSFNSV